MADFRIGYLVNALIFTVLGLLVFAAALALMERMTPPRVWTAILEERNLPAAILAAAVAIGIALIVAAAMH
ncbi:MAG: DUF350 domain-containing protein [Bryobacterales bacterium]|nr:DUF350 domain-containing protein [Bryobacterales bacterium]